MSHSNCPEGCPCESKVVPTVGSKWLSQTTRKGSVWTVRSIGDQVVVLTEDGGTASRICPFSLFPTHYEPAQGVAK